MVCECALQAVLAVGFTQAEFERLCRLFHEDMEAEVVKVRRRPAFPEKRCRQSAAQRA
jgi:hypothetical protein